MKRIFTILTILLLLIPSCRRNTGYVMIQGYAQGGTYTVKLNMDGVAVSPEKIREGIDSVLTLIDTTLSGYNKGSILSAFNRGEKVRPNPLFLDMYSLAYSWYERTEGAIDCAAGPVFDLWGFGFKSGEMPSDEDVRSAVASSGMGRLSKDISSLVGEDGFLNPSDIVLSGDAALPVLNYNAIAQGLSADMVAAYLSKLGVKDMLVDIGEIFCKGVNPDGRAWSVGIDRPVDGNNSPGADLEGVWRSKGTPCGIVTSIWIKPASARPPSRIRSTGDRMQSMTPVEIHRDAFSLYFKKETASSMETLLTVSSRPLSTGASSKAGTSSISSLIR